MKIHHLDCCTMCPVGSRWLNEDRHMVSHCLLVETDRHGLVLVDAGIGLADVADPGRRLGRGFTAAVRPRSDEASTAIRQIEALGLDPTEVRHVVVTHLDLDHAGGLGDFPKATVHVHERELAAATNPTARERSRYRKCQWAHGPNWSTYGDGGEAWLGFEAARPLDGLDDAVRVIPLAGHTRGHAAVAVRGDESAGDPEWWIHAGDAYFHHHTVDPTAPEAGPALKMFEAMVAVDRAKVRANHGRLAEIASRHRDEATVFCAHDPSELAAARTSRSVQGR